ncbi:MAG: hypothetical protein FWH05_05145 [Oscillospiraceae bacterium]|nr:hypothetical protein [Oscillospiraceae bacterium]
MKAAHKFGFFIASFLVMTFFSSFYSFSADTSRHYFDDKKVINTGRNNGYSGSNEIDSKDLHFGWRLGRFSVSGFTRVAEDDNGNPVFIKTLGDTVDLWFLLEQDIDALNGDNKLVIDEDSKGHDQYFGIPQTNFGRGTLITRHIDYQNFKHEPVIYTDFLAANAMVDVNTRIELFEEGDYEIALNYKVNDKKLFGSSADYRIYFQFSVRNGNCMVFPFDVETKAELTNSAFTENGFYLDLAKSRYLNIDIRRDELVEGVNGLTEDTRFNRPAKDGDMYTDDGIYTITVSNRYTDERTEKQIYVGTNNILRAHVVSGLSIEYINEQLSLGATISDNGELILPTTVSVTTELSEESFLDTATETVIETEIEAINENAPTFSFLWVIAFSVILLIILCIVFTLHKRRSLKSGCSRCGNNEAGVTNTGQEDKSK